MRLDLFLDRVCLFKTRSAAAKAIDAGRVLVDGVRPKRSQSAEVGSEIEIVTLGAHAVGVGGDRVLRLRVTRVPAGSVSKKTARECYEVLEDSGEEGA